MFRNLNRAIPAPMAIGVVAVLAIILGGGILADQYFQEQGTGSSVTETPPAPEPKAEIKEISIQRPNIVVKGENLSRVEVYMVPTGTGIDPETMSRKESATKQSENDGRQIWTFHYPDGLLVSGIFAKGFDSKGDLVGKVDLPIIGATSLGEALYGGSEFDPAWKTYRNNNYGFEIQYPKEAVGQAGTEGQQPSYFSYTVSGIPIVSKNPALSRKGFNLRVIDKSDSYFYSFWCGPGLSNSRGSVEDKTQIINGIDFTTRTFSEAGNNSWGDYPEYFTVKNDKCFVVTFSLIGNRYTGLDGDIAYERPYYQDGELGLFKQIMSTFKFTK